jgi:hypothetical protein
MEELLKNLTKINSLIKAIKAKSLGNPSLPTIPALKKPTPPSITPKIPNKMPGITPETKKDPKKVAQQIKDGSMSTKTQKIMLKTAKNGQWTLESDPKSDI